MIIILHIAAFEFMFAMEQQHFYTYFTVVKVWNILWRRNVFNYSREKTKHYCFSFANFCSQLQKMYTIPDPRSQCDLILFPFHGVPLTENPAPFFLRDDEMNLGIRIHTYISTCLCIILSWSLLCAHYYRAKVMLEELLLAFSACLSQNYKLCRASCRKDVKALFTSRQERKKWDIVLDLVTRWLGRHTPTWSSSLVCVSHFHVYKCLHEFEQFYV